MSFSNVRVKGVSVPMQGYTLPALELCRWNGQRWEQVDLLPINNLNGKAKAQFLATIRDLAPIGADLIISFLAECGQEDVEDIEIQS